MKAAVPLDVMPVYRMQAFHMMPSGLQLAAKSEPAKVAADFCHQTKQTTALVYTSDNDYTTDALAQDKMAWNNPTSQLHFIK